MVQSIVRSMAVVFLLLVLRGSPMLAQTARLTGQVTDQQGAAIPGALVQVVNQSTVSKRETKTDGTGAYSVLYLPPGSYQIVVQAQGFSSTASQPIALAAGQALIFNVQLTLGQVQSDVTVNGEGGARIELDSAALSGTLSEKEVTGFGLNGRNFSQLITLTPGVSNQSGQDEAKVGVAGSAKFSVNGGRVEYNTFEVDGSDVLNTSINASRGQGQPLIVYPSIDAIQEMQVLTSNYGAQYGKSASGSVLVTTKSGSAAFHGDLYGFIRNEMFNARNYFDQPEPQPVGHTGKPIYRTPLYRRQDYGGTIGGPIFIPGHYNAAKDKTFFFFSEELRLEKTPVDYNQAVPTLAERTGDFTDVCPFDAQSGGTNPPVTGSYPDCPITGRDANGSAHSMEHVNISDLAGPLLNTNTIPLPNSATGCNTTNQTSNLRCYVGSVSPATYWREELFRIDHNLTPSQLLSFRYVHDAWNTTTLTPQWGVVQNSFPTVENQLTGPGLDMVLSLAQTLPHGFLNRIAFSYAVEHISLLPQAGPGVTSLARPQILDDPAAVPGLGTPVANTNCTLVVGPVPPPVTGYQPQQLVECPMGSIFPGNGFSGKMPGLVFQGNNGSFGGHGFAADTGYAPWNQSNPTFNLRDDAGKTIGRHTLQFGAEAAFVQQNETSAVSGANSGNLQGLLTFSNQQSISTTGNAFADFLAGPGIAPLLAGVPQTGLFNVTAVKSFTQDSTRGRYYDRYKALELYLQDDWRISSRLTLNLGLRVSLLGAWYNPNGTAWNWEPQAYNQALGASINVDPGSGALIRNIAIAGPAGLSAVPLNLSHLDPVITNGLVQCGGNNGVPDSCMSNRLFHPAPRVGIAWDPFGNGRTAIRAGYGLFWEHGTGYEANVGSLIGSAPLVLSETETFPTTYNSIGTVCAAGCNGTGSSISSQGTFPLNVTSIPTQAVYSYTQQWSLSLQRELRRDLVGSLAYVGTKGTHLTAIRDLNQLQPAPSSLFPSGQPLTADICAISPFPVNGSYANAGVLSSPAIGKNQVGYNNAVVACTGSPGAAAGLSVDVLRPYTGFSNIISLENVADSQYHALQGTLRRIKGPLTLGVAYTYSHSLDDSSDRSGANFADSLTLKSNWASSDFDQRHLLNVSYIYDLPLLPLLAHFRSYAEQDQAESDAAGAAATSAAKSAPRGNWTPGPLLRTLLGDWQFTGIATYQTGTPFSVVNVGSQTGGPGVPNGRVATADNAGVGDGLGIGSYADVAPYASGTKPTVPTGSSTVGPLLGNPSRFVAPRGLTFGDSGRNYLNNPARTNFNMALLKHFKMPGGRDVEFRTEVFNVFNHTQFRIYDPSHPGNTGNNIVNCYGNVTTGYSAGASNCLVGNSFLHPVDAHDPRILQFALKLAF